MGYITCHKTKVGHQEKLSYAELDEIPEGMPIDPVPYPNKTLVKGSGDAVYLMMGGQKKYLPWGDTNILDSYRNEGINVDKITTISDEKLADIRTDDGVPETDFYYQKTKRVNFWKPLLSAIANCIPGLNLAYGALDGLLGKDLITGQKLSGGNRLLSFFGSGGFGELSKLAGAANLGKLTTTLNSLEKTFGSLNKLANTINTLNKASIAIFANDLTDGSGRKIQGANRFMAGLEYMGTDFSKILPKGLNNLHLPFSNILHNGAAEYLTKTYQLGVSATGREGVLFGKKLSDEERINLGTKFIGSYIGDAIGNINKDRNKDGKPDGLIESFKQEGIQLGQDLYKGGQALTQMAIQAYKNAANLVPYLNFTTTTNNSIPKDQDGYIKLDIAYELSQTLRSIEQTGENILTTIRETVRDYQQDYARYVAFKEGELSIDEIGKQLKERNLSIDDALDLATKLKKWYNKGEYGDDATKIIELVAKNGTAGEIFHDLTKYVNTDAEITKALAERFEKLCGPNSIQIVGETNQQRIQINLKTAIEILGDNIIGNIPYLGDLMNSAIVGEAAGEGAKQAMTREEVGKRIVQDLKSQENVKAWAEGMKILKQDYNVKELGAAEMIWAVKYVDEEVYHDLIFIYQKVIQEALKEAGREYLREMVLP